MHMIICISISVITRLMLCRRMDILFVGASCDQENALLGSTDRGLLGLLAKISGGLPMITQCVSGGAEATS